MRLIVMLVMTGTLLLPPNGSVKGAAVGAVADPGKSNNSAMNSPQLVGHWAFNEGAGSTAFDLSGNANHATIQGATWVSGDSWTGLSFDGSDDYLVAAPVNVSFVTVAAWVRYDRFFADDAGHAIVSNGHFYFDQGYMLYQSCESPYNCVWAFVRTPTGYYGITSHLLLNTGEWYHLVMTYDGSALKLFINGVQDASIAATGAINPSLAYPLLFGSTYTPSGNKFAGVIDDVRIYDGALSDAEVKSLFYSSRTCAAVLSGPANGSTVIGTPLLSWSAPYCANVDQAKVILAQDAGFNSVMWVRTVVGANSLTCSTTPFSDGQCIGSAEVGHGRAFC